MKKYTIIPLLGVFLLLGATVFALSDTELEKSKKIRLENRESIIKIEGAIEKLDTERERLEKENESRRFLECSLSADCEEVVEDIKAPIERTDGWRVNSAGDSKHIKTLCGSAFDTSLPACNMKSILEYHSLPYQAFVDGERKHLIKKELTFCIAWADSDLGRQLKSSNNIGNVGNNDRGQVVHYATIEKGIEAMYQVLNNNYLGHKQSIGSLSPGGGGNAPFYATSAENWNNNVLNCLNTILDPNINEDWNFRIK